MINLNDIDNDLEKLYNLLASPNNHACDDIKSNCVDSLCNDINSYLGVSDNFIIRWFSQSASVKESSSGSYYIVLPCVDHVKYNCLDNFLVNNKYIGMVVRRLDESCFYIIHK